MENNHTPDIRFEGFTGDWEQCRLGNIVNVLDGDRGKEYPSGNDLLEIGHTAFLNANNVTKNGFSFNKLQYITELKSNLMGNGKVNLGDTILTSRGSVGNIAYYNDYIKTRIPYARINSGMLILRPGEGIYPGYVTQYLKSSVGERQIKLIIFGSAQPQLTKRDVTNLKIMIPRLTEQKRITSLIELLDNYITLHQQELTTLKQTKQGFLQKMFPKEGESVPEVRFPGFTEDWEQRELRDVTAEAYQGINTAGDKVEYSDEGVEILQSKHITGGKISFDDIRYLDKERYSNYFPKYVPKIDDILFANIGTIGPSIVVNITKEFLVAWNIMKITLNENGNPSFIQTSLQRLNNKRYFESVTTGNATKFVNKDEMLRTPISLPNVEEQKKLGSFFHRLDDTIALQQQELDALQETKKAFLQKMFV